MKLSQAVKDSLKNLIALAGDGISEIEVEKRLFGWKIRISKAVASPMRQEVVLTAGPAQAAPAEDADVKEDHEEGVPVVSPMVGTFYRAPSPDADPFVKEGDMVSVGQTVCIIEAMKIMNEIEVEVSGRVTRVLLENGVPVEYNTPLFIVDPS